VTGAASGIGLRIAQLFIKEGAKVVLVISINSAKLQLMLLARMLCSLSVIFPMQSQSRIWLKNTGSFWHN
jgi:NAD(P)-dependent dehydrogenase (short-subunit alcohol dehydrogenase family)